MVEFSLVALLMLVMVLGIMDLAFLFAGRVMTTNSVRWTARYAAVHPTSWDASANPPLASIEGQLRNQAVPAKLPNLDANIVIRYLDPIAGSAGTVCGQYTVAAGGSFVPQNGYTQATCVVPNHIVTITATYIYSFFTPMLRQTFGTVNITSTASEIEET